MKQKLYTTLGMSLFLAGDIYALEERNKEKEFQLNKIETISSHLDTIDANKIQQRQPGLLKDIMRDIPGVSVGGSSATAQRIQMRGLNQEALNVTIDGARQKGTIFHHNSNLLVDPDVLSAVGISVGTNSIVANSGALGGGVAFRTLEAGDLLEAGRDFGFRVKTGYGSNNQEWQKSITLYGKAWDMLEILTYVNHRSHDFGSSGPSDGKTFPGNIGSGDKNKKYQIGGRGEVINGLIKSVLAFSDTHKLSFGIEHLEYNGLYPWRGEFAAFYKNPDTGEITGQQRYPTSASRNTYTLQYNLGFENFSIESNAYYTQVRYKVDFELKDLTYKSANIGRGLPQWNLNTDNMGWKTTFKNQFQTQKFSHTFSYGYDWYTTIQHNGKKNEIIAINSSASGKSNAQKGRPLKADGNTTFSTVSKTEATNGATVVAAADGTTNDTYADTVKVDVPKSLKNDMATNVSLYLEYNLKYDLGYGHINLTPGVRYDYYRLDSSGFDNTYHQPVFAVGLSYKTPFGLGGFANWTQLFRGPDVLEGIFLVDKETSIGENKSLKPETGENYEIGIDWHQSFQDTYSLGFVGKYFHSTYHNLIAYKGGKSGQTRIHNNTGGVIFNGVEIALRGAIYNLGISLGYTHYHAKTSFSDGTPYYISPFSGDKYSWNLEYLIDQIGLIVGYNGLAYTDYKKSGEPTKPGFNIHDIYFSYVPENILEGLSLTLGFYNVGNTFYSDPNNKSNDIDPGFNTRVSLGYKF